MYFIWRPQQQLRLDPKFLGTVPEKGFATSIAPLMSESTANIQGVGEYTDCCAKLSAPVSGYKTDEFPTEEVRAVVTRYIDAMREIATSLLDILVIVFEIPEENLTEMRRLGIDATSLQRFLYFPDVPDDRVAEEMQMRMAPHQDIDLLTLDYHIPACNGFESLEAEINDAYRLLVGIWTSHLEAIAPFKYIEYGVYADLVILCPKPYSIY